MKIAEHLIKTLTVVCAMLRVSLTLLSALAATVAAYQVPLALPATRVRSAAPSGGRAVRVSAAPQAQAVALPLKAVEAPRTNKLTRLLVGSAFCASVFICVTAIYPFVLAATLYSVLFDNARRRGNDWVVQIWARASLLCIGSKVTVEGAENLPPPTEAVMYTPNHCSFLDIFSLSGYLPRRFKYISKIEILRIPLIGWAMLFAKHIAIRRSDRASQMQTLKDAIETLKAGNSLVTFPEGTRSKDGRIMDFKKGPFTMAARAGVRVVPISIIGTHVFQPAGAFAPIAIPRGVRIVVHPALDPPVAKQEQETSDAAKRAIMSALPSSMLPVPTDTMPRA